MSILVLTVTVTTAEVVCHHLIVSPFIAMTDRCANEAFERMAIRNFWVFICADYLSVDSLWILFNHLLHFRADDLSTAIPLATRVITYYLIKNFAVK